MTPRQMLAALSLEDGATAEYRVGLGPGWQVFYRPRGEHDPKPWTDAAEIYRFHTGELDLIHGGLALPVGGQ